MAEDQARTLVPVTADRQALILEKVIAIEGALQGLVPLLQKIVAQLESQTSKVPVPIATYEDLYAAVEAGPPEGELVAAVLQPQARKPVGWWGWLFTTRNTS